MSTEVKGAGGRSIAFYVGIALVVLLPLLLGKGGMLASAVLAMAMLGTPLFVIIGVATVLCFVLWSDVTDLAGLSVLIERIRGLADAKVLLAVPFFIMAGAVMAKGEISRRLVEFARALVGWCPGGLAISAVIACMLFAAISGSSPATVIAIGAMVGPALIASGYQERFSQGLLTSAGSLGILIPPSIPMIIYPLVYQGENIEVKELFAAGIGPGLVIGGILIGFSIYRGMVDKAPRSPFEPLALAKAARDGAWALAFPVLILGGIYSGIFTVVEAAAISVVYAVIVEVYIHRAIKLADVPRIFQETGVFLGALLVIMVAALALTEFLESEGIPAAAVAWIESLDLELWQFLIALNLLLLVVGMAMDILSAMFVFVPLLAPMAIAMGVDPVHFGIIFIVNLEIGYLTPPVGLNLFVASTLFDKPIEHIIRAVLPFIVLMIVGLALITYIPSLSVDLGRWLLGVEDPVTVIDPSADTDSDGGVGADAGVPDQGEAQNMNEMMMEALEGLDAGGLEGWTGDDE
jgi:C4-dicarboxylate transporter DctM subunit